jgi:hypothetical protein
MRGVYTNAGQIASAEPDTSNLSSPESERVALPLFSQVHSCGLDDLVSGTVWPEKRVGVIHMNEVDLVSRT